MSAITLPSNRSNTLQTVGRAARIAFNVFIFLLLLWAAAIDLFGFPYRLGIDGQKTRCLPWSVFIIQRTVPTQINKGDLLQFKAGALGFGFDGLLFVKQVGAVPGDRVEVRNDVLYINGTAIDRLWLMKTMKREKGSFDRSFIVPSGEYLMIGTARESFDGRYWGTIKKEQILGNATPLF